MKTDFEVGRALAMFFVSEHISSAGLLGLVLFTISIFLLGAIAAVYWQSFRLVSGLWLILLLSVGLSGAITRFFWQSS